MSTLAEIEAAAAELPLEDKESLLVWLSQQLDRPAPIGGKAHSVLDIKPVSVGRVLRPLNGDDDLLGEMLEGRG